MTLSERLHVLIVAAGITLLRRYAVLHTSYIHDMAMATVKLGRLMGHFCMQTLLSLCNSM